MMIIITPSSKASLHSSIENETTNLCTLILVLETLLTCYYYARIKSTVNRAKMARVLKRFIRHDGLRLMGNTAKLSAANISTSQRSCSGVHPFAQLSETHEMLRKTCRDYADNVLKPIAGEVDKNHMYPAKQVNF